jgi:hypothetical protein
MDDIPFYQKPWFNSIVLGIILAGIYIYNLIWQGGLWENILGIVLDLLLFVLLFQVCVFFYAQFILPIRTLNDRKKIVSRLWLHSRNAHGPAIFIENGRKVEREGESDKRGPGVLWVDTASAVVTRTFTTFKQVLGPGVHFIESNEKIATIISLHTQTHSIGPARGDDPFWKLNDNPNEEERKKYQEIRSRCMAVRAITRDGIEVYPNISIAFKIDAKSAETGEKGSHFGFNADAVEKAARSEGINPYSNSEEKRRVDWNQLPALIAADLWREYLSKFTLSELFDPSIPVLPEVPQPETPPAFINMPKTPLLVRRGFAARLLRNFNNSFERHLDELIPQETPPVEQPLSTEQSMSKNKEDPKKQTALQIINQMMKTRLTQAVVCKLDECGRLLEGYDVSNEHKKLKDRGIAVLNVSINGLKFSPVVESQLLEHWNTSWLANARTDQSRIERLNTGYADKGRQKAVLDHAFTLSQAIMDQKPANISSAVKTLLKKTESEIKLNDRLLSRMSGEIETLDDLVKWMELKNL